MIETNLGDALHIMPCSDLLEHTYVACKCNPKIEDTWNGGKIIIHNSFDGRELLECSVQGSKESKIQ